MTNPALRVVSPLCRPGCHDEEDHTGCDDAGDEHVLPVDGHRDGNEILVAFQAILTVVLAARGWKGPRSAFWHQPWTVWLLKKEVTRLLPLCGNAVLKRKATSISTSRTN